MERKIEMDLMKEIKQRQSAQTFSNEAVASEDLEAILLAATLAPSAYNEQPWRFFVAAEQEDKEFLIAHMLPNNVELARKAPVLILVAASMEDTHNGLYNYWSAFDSGCAWGYLSLEAQRRGYVTHCFGGFDRHDLKEAFSQNQALELYGIVALGKSGNAKQIEAQIPQPRKTVNAVRLRRK